jgi:hypothetical protein
LALGGGQGAFDNSNGAAGITVITQLTTKPTNANGTYTLGTVTATSVVITGTGTEKGDDGQPLQVVMSVFPDSTAVNFTN